MFDMDDDEGVDDTQSFGCCTKMRIKPGHNNKASDHETTTRPPK